MTCKSVEAESRKAIEALYPKQFKNGTISFMSVNLDEESGEAIAKKIGVGSQTLLVICNKNKVDITSQGFMYARNNPEKLRETIKKTVEQVSKVN